MQHVGIDSVVGPFHIFYLLLYDGVNGFCFSSIDVKGRLPFDKHLRPSNSHFPVFLSSFGFLELKWMQILLWKEKKCHPIG